ncbi:MULTISPECIES: hypothetical protein [Bacillus]|uniref:Uncharacterized protein n=1 Tax=Bacillus wiedmannii TaxID=1890302 RepID=A0A2B6GJS7_9BACI|nr:MULTISPECIES: hypothetical protein [Bacillus]MDF9666495.1 hypothetical protein [Bacillus wiedmannii]PFZ25833.1 hypothetical protein COL51_16770 [Bacillus wiedmannii]PGC11129.1 hypothetical protein COM08_30020 [Bacillus wiedmannii]PGC49418.1 hypothetical protein COM22_29670 [Bacillus wiedmannii]PGD30280.1 hypothetical protein COM27_25065 [Bacillus wiedmannii]
MRVRKERIFFRKFIDRSYKDKENTIRKYNSLSPFAFFHMSDQVLNTYIALGIMGTVLIGAVLLEKYLVQNEHILAAKVVSGSIYYGMRIGGVCLIGYAFVRIVIMF